MVRKLWKVIRGEERLRPHVFWITLVITFYLLVGLWWFWPRGRSFGMSLDSLPDGSFQLFSIKGKIYLHRRGGDRNQFVAEGDCPRFAGDVDHILFSGLDGRVWFKDLKTGKASRITSGNSDVYDEQVAFDARAKKICFGRYVYRPWLSNQRKGWDIFCCDLSGTNLEKITNRNFWSLSLSSAFHRGVMYFVETEQYEGLRDSAPEQQLARVDLQTKRLIVDSWKGPKPWEVAAGRDGRMAVVVAGKVGEQAIYRLDEQKETWIDTTGALGAIYDPIALEGHFSTMFLYQEEDGFYAELAKYGNVQKEFKLEP